MTAAPDAAGSNGLRIATIGGIPVYLGRSWPILALVIVALVGPNLAQSRPDLGALAYAIAALYAVLLLVAVLVHEGAHAVAARSFGMPVHRVVADLWGGHTALDASTATPGPSAVVAVVGPIANGVLAALGFAVSSMLQPGVPHGLAGAFGFLNAALAAFNLLPGLPLDGGQIVEAAVWRVTGSRSRGRVVAGYCGLVVTALVVGYAVVLPIARGETPSLTTLIWSLLIAMFLWQGARSAIAWGTITRQMDEVRITDVWTPAVTVPDTARLADLPTGVPTVLVDASGRPRALVDSAALAAVPAEARWHTPVTAVARPQPDGWVVEADPNGTIGPLIAGFAAAGTGLVAVTQHGRLVGLVTAQAVNEQMTARIRR